MKGSAAPKMRPSQTLLLLLTLLATPTELAAQPLPVGDQFQVNTYTPNAQVDPDVAMDENGNFVVVWESRGVGGIFNFREISAQRFDSTGSPIGGEFIVNSEVRESQDDPSVAMNAAGDFVVVWQDEFPNDPDTEIRAKRYASDGSILGDEFAAAAGEDDQKPAVDLRDDGTFVVSWIRNFNQGRALRFDSNGSPVGSIIDLGTSSSSSDHRLAVAALPEGETAVAFDTRPAVEVQFYDSFFAPVGTVFELSNDDNDNAPSIDADAEGDFWVAWKTSTESAVDGDSSSVRAQRFASDGAAVGSAFQINGFTTGEQDEPVVALLEGGEALIAWQTETAVAEEDLDIEGTYFNSGGDRIAGQFQINTYTTSRQRNAKVASDGRGRFVVVWESIGSPGNDSSGTSIHARLYALGVSGRVFLDLDFDGLQDAGEGGARGVAVHLYDAVDFSRLASTSTDSSGVYAFADRPDRYFLEFEAPEAYVFTAKDQGSDDSLDSDVRPATGRTASFSAVQNGTWDAGLTNGLGDRVWLDLDGDGIQDGGEPGAAGVTVELFDALGSNIASTVSDGAGRYAFADLSPNEYYVVFTAPEGFTFSPQLRGNDSEVDSDADPVTGATAAVIFAHGDLVLDLDAGLIADNGIELLDGPEPRGVSGDFQVNSVTTGSQYDPAAVKLADGSFVLTWQSATSSGDDNDQLSVQMRRYASDGSTLGGEQQVNTLTAGTQSRPDIAAAPDGGFWIAWESDVSSGDDSSSDSIQLRRFDSLGSAIGTEFQGNLMTSGAQRLAALAVAGDGSAVVSWSGSSDSSGESVPARVFDSSGSPVGDEFTVNSYTPLDQYLGDVTALESGEFLVVWSSPTVSDGRQIFGRRVSTDGAPVGDDFQLSQSPGESPTAFAAAGGFVVAWTDYSSNDLLGRFFGSGDQALGPEFVLGSSPFFKEIAAVSEERFLITWQLPADGDSAGVVGQLFDFPGRAVGSAFQINSYTTGLQADPHVAGDPETGRALVVWEGAGSPGDDDSGRSVVGRLLQFPAEIGDLVFEDSDFDGFQDAGEPGLGGVSVGLHDENGQLIGETTSDADGRFAFNSFVEAGSFQASLRFESPAGLSFTTPNSGDDVLDSDPDPPTGKTAVFEIRAGQIDHTRDAGLAAGLGNRVWLDADGNGVQDGGEAGFAGVVVTLLDGEGASIEQTVSDSGGTYTFTGLDSGAYSLEVVSPPGYELTPRDRGSDDVADSDFNAAGRSSNFLYVAGSINADLDAGLVAQALASIGDRVWLDANLNGIQDGGEAGFEGVVIELFTSGGASIGVTVTDAGGSYLFDDLAGGDYYLVFSEPAGFCFTARDQGGGANSSGDDSDAIDSDVDPLTLTTSIFSLSAGVADLTRDAGLVPDASVGNRIWLDDGDGLQAGGEPGVENVTVNLYDSADMLIGSTSTDAGGHYAFSPGPGEYFLEFVLPADTAFAPRDRGDDAADSDAFASGRTGTFTLGPGQVDVSRDAGIEPAVIGNRVWLDENADGRQQPQEVGIAGVTVRLWGAADVEVASTTTGLDGIYQFVGVATGSYRIEVELPTDGVFSARDVGANTFEAELIDSDVDPATGRSELFDYTAGSASRGWDAGLSITPLFADDFETGDASAWSAVVP